MKSVQKHIIILVGLIIVSVVLAFTEGKRIQTSFETDLFSVADTAHIKTISIHKSNSDVTISRSTGDWLINDSLAVDPSLIQIFNAIISQVEVVRPVSLMNKEEVKKDLTERGQKVSIFTSTGENTFYTGGNSGKTQAYFADENFENIYIVHIPGYKNYVSGIFELTRNQWRARTLFASSWRTIQSLTISYTDSQQDDLNIYFDTDFMKVQGVNQIDTTALMAYLEQFDHFQLNDYLNAGEFPKFDSLTGVTPIAQLKLIDIDKTKNIALDIYPKIPNQRFYLFTDAQKQMIVIDEKRVNQLLKSPTSFQSK